MEGLEEQRIQVAPDVTLTVYTGGPTDAPVIIFLHGFPDYSYTWRYQAVPMIEEGFRVICPDMRGFNTSDKPGEVTDYAMEHLISDVHEVIKSTGKEKVFLVGHDWGAAVAWQMCIMHPLLIEKCVVINGAHSWALTKRLTHDLAQVQKSWYLFYFQLASFPENLISESNFAYFKSVISSEPGYQISEESEAKYQAAWSQEGALTSSINYFRNVFPGIGQTSYNPPPKITVPMMVIWGEQDLSQMKELAQESADLCENVEVFMIPDGGHWCHWSNDMEVNEQLQEFFQANS